MYLMKKMSNHQSPKDPCFKVTSFLDQQHFIKKVKMSMMISHHNLPLVEMNNTHYKYNKLRFNLKEEVDMFL
jgi:hypothetical protein